MSEILQQAYEIALKDLRACYQDGKIVAGRRHFDDFWARDAFFAIRGVKELGDLEVVKNTLELFLKYQKSDGQVPRKIIRHKTWLKYIFGVRRERKELKPIYTSSTSFSRGADQNSLLVIAAKMYFRKSQDLDFLKKYYSQLKRVIFWNFGQDQDEDRLIDEGYFANWMDSTIKSGEVLYTNVLHANALQSFIELSEKLGKQTEAEHFQVLADKLKEKINQKFWNQDYYFDWIQKRRKYDYFDTVGNLLAIYFNIADQEQAIKILDFTTKQLAQQKSKLLFTNYPAYPWWRSSPTRFISLSLGYHNHGYQWLWIQCFYALAYHKIGQDKRAEQALLEVAKTIISQQRVYEVYDNGQPVNSLLFHSEVPFAWSAGVFCYAYSKIFSKKSSLLV